MASSKKQTSKVKAAPKKVQAKKVVAKKTTVKKAVKKVAPRKVTKVAAKKAAPKKVLAVRAMSSKGGAAKVQTQDKVVLDSKSCSRVCSKLVTFVFGVAVGALLMWIAVSFASSEYGKNNTLKFFPSVNNVDTKLNTKTAPKLNPNYVEPTVKFIPNVDGD